MLKKNDLLEENAGSIGLYESAKDPVEGDGDILLVKRALTTLEEGQMQVENELMDWEQIQDDYDNAFSTEGLMGAKFMYSKETFNTVKKVVEKLDLLNFNVEIAPTKEELTEGDELQSFMKQVKERRMKGEQISSEFIMESMQKIKERMKDERRIASAVIKVGIEYVMREGGWVNALKNDKDGAHFILCLLGDAFIFIEAKGKKENNNPIPIAFTTMQPDRIFFNRDAVKMRNSARGGNVRRAIMVYDMTWDEYLSDVVPQIKDEKMRKKAENIVWGSLPYSKEFDNLNEKKEGELKSIISESGQIAVFIDLDAKAKIMIAGAGATIISQFLDDEFPYMLGGEPYMPVIQLSCFAKARGFYNAGIGHYMSEVNQLDELLQNKTVSGAIKEVDPMDVLTVGNGKSNQVQARINDVELDIAEGRRAFLLNEVGDDGNPMIGRVDKLSSGGIGDSGAYISEIRDRLKIEMGINIRDVATEKEKTAFAIQQEAAAQTALPQGIGERNAPEYKFAINVIVDLMKKFISEKNTTVIPTREIKLSSGVDAITVTGVTLGEVVAMLKKSNVIVTMEDLSGVTPTNIEKMAGIDRLLPILQGTPAGNKLIKEYVELNGYSFTEEELQAPMLDPMAEDEGAAPQGNPQQVQQQ